MNTDLSRGLTDSEILKSRELNGLNMLTPPKRDPWYVLFLEKFKDPLIQILSVAAIIALILGIIKSEYLEPIGIIAAIIILARELIISAFRQIAATKNVVMAADIYGKVKTVFQFITLIFYFLYAFVIEEFYNANVQGWLTANTILNIIGYVLLAITVIMTIVSAWKYISNNRQVLKDAK